MIISIVMDKFWFLSPNNCHNECQNSKKNTWRNVLAPGVLFLFMQSEKLEVCTEYEVSSLICQLLLEVICLIGVHWLFFLAAGTVGFTWGSCVWKCLIALLFLFELSLSVLDTEYFFVAFQHVVWFSGLVFHSVSPSFFPFLFCGVEECLLCYGLCPTWVAPLGVFGAWDCGGRGNPSVVWK